VTILKITNNILARFSLHHSSRRVQRWLIGNAEGFAICRNEGSVAIKGNPVPWRIKQLSELMLFLIIVARHEASHKRLGVLERFALDEARKFDWHELAAFDPAAATPLALVLEFFEFHGREAPFEIEYFRQLEVSGYFAGMDRLPYREMDIAYALSRTGRPAAAEHLPHLFADTCFGRGQLIPRYSVDDIYSLTHSIFYLTDVGCRSVDRMLPPEMLLRLRSELIALTVAMLRYDNLDVLGELLLCWIMCGFVPQGNERAIFEAGLTRMMQGVTADGAVPPTSTARHRFVKGDIGFADVYHTTLVAGILFALASKRR
jgi:hypothetical protein